MGKIKSWFNKFCEQYQKGDALKYNEGRLYREISNLARNRFQWEGLPEGIESRHIEKFLYENGEVGFYFDDKLGYVCFPCSDGGSLNNYGDAIQYNLTGEAGYSELVDKDDMVRIIANDMATPSVEQVRHYTAIIDEIEKTSYMNLRQQRFPFIISTTKQNELAMKNLLKKINNLEEAIFVDEKLSMGGDVGIDCLKTDAPYLLDKLQEHKNDILNELYSWLGLNNTNNDKKERLLVDEVNVNNSHILMNLELEFKNRELACKKINEKYPELNVKVVKTIDTLDLGFKGDDNKDKDKKKGLFK